MNLSRLLAVCLLWPTTAWPGVNESNDDPGKAVRIEEILLLGPISTPLEKALPSGGMKEEQLRHLANLLVADGLPAKGEEVEVFGQRFSWRRAATEGEGDFQHSVESSGIWAGSVALDVSRWVSVVVEIRSPGELKTFVDDEPLPLERVPDADSSRGRIKMTSGTHHLLFLFDRKEGNTRLEISLKSEYADDIHPHLSAQRLVSGHQLYAAPDVRSLSISPDGREVLLSVRWRAGDSWREVLELRRFDDGSLIRSWVADQPGNLDWSPDGQWISYTTQKDRKSDLWIEGRKGDSRRRLLDGLERIGGFRWSPDSSSILFQWTSEEKPRKDGFKRYRGLPDRWTGWRNRSQIFQVDVRGGWMRRLTDSIWTSRLEDVSLDSKRILVSRGRPDYSRPAYMATELSELDIESGETRPLGEFTTFNSALYWGDSLLIEAGPTAFDQVGADVREGQVPNDYDSQIFLYDPHSKSARPLSKDFDPSISSIETDFKRGLVLLTATDQTRVSLFRLEVEKSVFTPLPSQMAVVEGFDYAAGAGRLVWKGTSATTPQKVMAMEIGADGPHLLAQPARDAFRQTQLGEVRQWSFESRRGDQIQGFFYTPPGFDPQKRYPLIVYYYGGTTPTTETFSSRYPANLWAAHGYVVYIVEPSGAIGYGQEFSARHVNAWGGQTADEIIEGTQRFVEAHKFVDSDRIGCIGASYGGFMTMYLISRTQTYSAAVSHAGISALSSYWGEGWWGYLYSGVATRGTLPWNNPQFYVDHSPLFQADKIHTPLLLLHGEEDTNVPIGESQQMYTALKLLDREVEFVSVAGENHQVLDFDKRMVWWDTILAWFDKQLKDEPQWWDDIYSQQGD